MVRAVALVLGVCLVVVEPVAGQSDERAKAVVAKALAALGKAAIEKRPAYRLRVKGKFFGGGKPVSFSSTLAASSPHSSRIETVVDGRTDIIVVAGDKGWIRTGSETRSLTEKELKASQADLYEDWVTLLFPLGRKEFSVSYLGRGRVLQREVVGVRVSSKGHPDVDMYFDPRTWLLVKKESKRVGTDGKEYVKTSVCSTFRKFDGVRIPTRWTTFSDGQKRTEIVVTEGEFMKELPKGTFEKP